MQYEGSGTENKCYFHADERGSIISETDGDGRVVATHQYGPFGEFDSGNVARFGYTGQIALPGTPLYHYKARVYNPKLGRFMQTDPIGYEDGMNWYAYVGNDPVNATDPTGESAMPFNFGNLVIKDKGSELAAKKQMVTQKAMASTTKTIIENTGKGAEVVQSLLPGGALIKAGTAIGVAGIKASGSDTPVETFAEEVAVEVMGQIGAKKVGDLMKALPDLKGVDKSISDGIKDVLGGNISDEFIKNEFREAINEKNKK